MVSAIPRDCYGTCGATSWLWSDSSFCSESLRQLSDRLALPKARDRNSLSACGPATVRDAGNRDRLYRGGEVGHGIPACGSRLLRREVAMHSRIVPVCHDDAEPGITGRRWTPTDGVAGKSPGRRFVRPTGAFRPGSSAGVPAACG